MNSNQEDVQQARKAVGVYDRPASADRLRNLRLWAILFAVVASVISLYVFSSA